MGTMIYKKWICNKYKKETITVENGDIFRLRDIMHSLSKVEIFKFHWKFVINKFELVVYPGQSGFVKWFRVHPAKSKLPNNSVDMLEVLAYINSIDYDILGLLDKEIKRLQTGKFDAFSNKQIILK